MCDAPSTELSPTQLRILNEALDRRRDQLGLSSDLTLAVALKTTPRIIWAWRSGRLTKLDRILVDLLVPEPKADNV